MSSKDVKHHLEWAGSNNGPPRWNSKRVLQKPGVDVNGMKADDMRKKLKEMHDFKHEKTKLRL